MKLKKVWSEQVDLLYQFLASMIIKDIFIAMTSQTVKQTDAAAAIWAYVPFVLQRP